MVRVSEWSMQGFASLTHSYWDFRRAPTLPFFASVNHIFETNWVDFSINTHESQVIIFPQKIHLNTLCCCAHFSTENKTKTGLLINRIGFAASYVQLDTRGILFFYFFPMDILFAIIIITNICPGQPSANTMEVLCVWAIRVLYHVIHSRRR